MSNYLGPKPRFLVFFFSFSIAVFIFFLFPKAVFAQVVINEFSSGTTSDWVEIYNNGAAYDISALKLIDSDGNQTSFPSCILKNNGTYAVNWSNKLNNNGDRISLLEKETIVDCLSYGSGPACNGEEIDLPVLDETEFGARVPGGTGNWVKASSSSKSDNSFCLIPTPTPSSALFPSPTLTPTSSLSPTFSPMPTPTATATYKINEVKDETGAILSQVEIYVNGQYTHHWAPEVLTFGDGRCCDDEKKVNCGFGEQTIKLEKSGFDNWQETKNIKPADFYEINPVMKKIQPTSSPTLAPVLSTPTKPIASLTPTLTVSGVPTPTRSEILAASISSATGMETLPLGENQKANLLQKEATVTGGETKKAKKDFLAFWLIGSGLIIFGLAWFFFKKSGGDKIFI